MGFLSETAQRAFERRPRRAYVPDWFRPFSYAALGLIGAVILVAGMLQSRPDATETVAAGVGEPIGAPSTTSAAQPAPTATPTASPVATGPVGRTVSVQLTGGSGTVQIAFDALVLAQRAARGLMTGSFEGVPLREGSVAPLALETWKDPKVGNVESALVFPDGSFNATFPVDPDGGGPEPLRVIDVTMTPVSGGWAYDPGL